MQHCLLDERHFGNNFSKTLCPFILSTNLSVCIFTRRSVLDIIKILGQIVGRYVEHLTLLERLVSKVAMVRLINNVIKSARLTGAVVWCVLYCCPAWRGLAAGQRAGRLVCQGSSAFLRLGYRIIPQCLQPDEHGYLTGVVGS